MILDSLHIGQRRVKFGLIVRHTSLLLVALIIGCGGSTSDQDKIRDIARQSIEATLGDHPESACQYTVDHDACIGAIATAHALNIQVSAIANYPKDWRARVDRAKITVNGSTATMSPVKPGGKPTRLVLRDGQWLVDNR